MSTSAMKRPLWLPNNLHLLSLVVQPSHSLVSWLPVAIPSNYSLKDDESHSVLSDALPICGARTN
jgi:hypothetical protein